MTPIEEGFSSRDHSLGEQRQAETDAPALNAELRAALKSILPAVDAYLMTGDAGAKALKARAWREAAASARAVLAKAEAEL